MGFKLQRILTSLQNSERIFDGCEDLTEIKRRIYENFYNIILYDFNMQKHRYDN